MTETIPSCSHSQSPLPSQMDGVLEELRTTEGLAVWGTHQSVLEQQASQELDILTQEASSGKQINNTSLEEGEVSSSDSSRSSAATAVVGAQPHALDIAGYIRKQQELKKGQLHRKSLLVSDKSKELADRISKRQATVISLKGKRKRGRRPNDNSKFQKLNNISKDIEKQNKIITEEENDDDEKLPVSNNNTSGSEYVPSDEDDEDYQEGTAGEGTSKQGMTINRHKNQIKVNKIRDDGCLEYYKARLDEYYKQLDDNDDFDCHEFPGGFKIPAKIWNQLYGYQQDGVKWLWELHQRITGGLLGDEMGLGKTVQIIAFLTGLEFSRIVSQHGRYTGLGPTLIVCPATVIHQWVKHFHDWSPELRVAVLHQSGSYQGNNKIPLISEINKNKAILITTYLGVLKYKGNLIEYNWHYLILDEGHKIRNPSAKISVAVKAIRTPHRLMLTGSPMQNNLQELWSLFDFTNPGMLGTLITFTEHFANPIVQGGFANATPMQEATAHSVAVSLKNLISPLLLRRTKHDVQSHIQLPNKSEQVLFCSLTDEQRDLYKGYLMSDQVNMILGRGAKNWYSENQMKSNVLVSITTLRKICNHPDLYLGEVDDVDDNDNNESTNFDDQFGYYKKSGKMIVVSALLKIWKKQKHRVLLFTQGRAMINVFQKFLTSQDYKFLRMDGTTSIGSRQPLINKFNEDSSYDVFLLTTRVGGLGVNLTGANRVIIYDPDWNPATDTQARERAWRIGQDKEVTIYRLLSAGTIEEKMYQRQVWKQLLSNKILLNPQTQRVFKSSNLYDLFSMPEDNVQGSDGNPETANIFRESRVKLQEKLRMSSERKKNKHHPPDDTEADKETIQFSDVKIQAMKDLAQQIARGMSSKSVNVVEEDPKTSYQLKLEEERRTKLEEKAKLKHLTPPELLMYNKQKLLNNKNEDDIANKFDDCDTNASFSKALEYSEKTSKLYHRLKSEKVHKIVEEEAVNDSDKVIAEELPVQAIAVKDKIKKKKTKKKRDNKERSKSEENFVDDSGTVDGEQVEGLLKLEIKMKKNKAKHKSSSNSNEAAQNEYILEKLFMKKGVSGALHHDSIVQSNVKTQSIRIHCEAQKKADLAIQALRKSRISNWRW